MAWITLAAVRASPSVGATTGEVKASTSTILADIIYSTAMRTAGALPQVRPGPPQTLLVGYPHKSTSGVNRTISPKQCPAIHSRGTRRRSTTSDTVRSDPHTLPSPQVRPTSPQYTAAGDGTAGQL